MDRELRRLYNAGYTPELHRRYLARLEEYLAVKVPLRIAETPVFIPRPLRVKLAKAAREIVARISHPASVEKMKRAIPPRFEVPRFDALPSCVRVDFAICRGADGELAGRVVGLRGFPSLYGLMVVQTDAIAAEMRRLPGLDRGWSLYFGGLDRARFVAKLKRAILGGHPAEEVVLLALDPRQQKTHADFVATRLLTGVDTIGPDQVVREGNRLFRRKDGRRVQIKRIYNRVAFDELAAKSTTLPFDSREDLDVSWFPHPNWYWIWSKDTLPYVDHPAVPKSTFLSDLRETPADLARYLMKPLFSHAGSVKVDVTRADIDAVPRNEREGWVLQEKVIHEPMVVTPDGHGGHGGHGSKVEVRMMFLRAPDDPAPELVVDLVRLTRGGDTAWGTVGIWPADEEPV